MKNLEQVNETYAFKIITYNRLTHTNGLGHVSVIKICGIPVYKRVGNVKSILGFVWGKN